MISGDVDDFSVLRSAFQFSRELFLNVQKIPLGQPAGFPIRNIIADGIPTDQRHIRRPESPQVQVYAHRNRFAQRGRIVQHRKHIVNV